MATGTTMAQQAAADMTPDGNSASTPNKKDGHQRAYQACVFCRQRKVKCDMGPVDNPHPPPCRRCKREGKECLFDIERRKKRPGEPDSPGVEDDAPDQRAAKRARLDLPRQSSDAQYSSHLNVRPTGHQQSRELDGGVISSDEDDEDEDDPQAGIQSTAVLQTSRLFSQSDALELLYKAAHHRSGSMSSAQQTASATTPNVPPMASPLGTFATKISTPQTSNSSIKVGMAREVARKVWSRSRFVRSGWLTAEEGISYIAYYFKHLHPMTPIAIPDYSDPDTHQDLLENEPILALTILTSASRHMQLTGPGAASRSPVIHQTLTNVLERKLNRIIWGQKQFGGGFCRAGQSSKVKTLWEDLSTVESLMLLTEWHPRSLHFPPGDDDGELLVPLDPLQLMARDVEGDAIRVGGVEGRRVDSWLEPCWRSDRMCWMLLNVAYTLAVESGVFDESLTVEEFRRSNPEISPDKVIQYFRRKSLLRDLLPAYCANTSGRLELTSNLPCSYLKKLQDEDDPSGRLKSRLKLLGIDSNFNPNHPNYALKRLDDHPVNAVVHFWVEITLILDHGNNRIYKNRSYTRELVESGNYMQHLEFYKPKLEDWYRNFKACKAIPAQMRHILLIEYEYTRAFLYLLSLHAIVMRCSKAAPNNANKMNHLAQVAAEQREAGQRSSGEGTPVPSSDYRHQDLRPHIGSDGPYVKEVADACRSVFNIVINGLAPNQALKHCPVRTYFRIISAALILLKTFVVGGSEQEITTSLTLLDRACKALKACIVDDVHVGNRFADMCDALARRIRSRFVRLAAHRSTAISRAQTPSRMETAGPTTGMPNGYDGNLRSLNGGSHVFGSLNNTNNNDDISSHAWSNTPNLHIPTATTQPSEFAHPLPPNRTSTPNPALWGVPDTIHDINNHNMTVLPPPTDFYMPSYDHFDSTFASTTNNPNGMSGSTGNGFSDALGDDGNWGFDQNGVSAQWLTVRMDNLVGGGEVQSTPFGPNIGGEDMLDRLLFLQDSR